MKEIKDHRYSLATLPHAKKQYIWAFHAKRLYTSIYITSTTPSQSTRNITMCSLNTVRQATSYPVHTASPEKSLYNQFSLLELFFTIPFIFVFDSTQPSSLVFNPLPIHTFYAFFTTKGLPDSPALGIHRSTMLAEPTPVTWSQWNNISTLCNNIRPVNNHRLGLPLPGRVSILRPVTRIHVPGPATPSTNRLLIRTLRLSSRRGISGSPHTRPRGSRGAGIRHRPSVINSGLCPLLARVCLHCISGPPFPLLLRNGLCLCGCHGVNETLRPSELIGRGDALECAASDGCVEGVTLNLGHVDGCV
eukprot:comp20356_c0_seq1/m.25701 comp20356_c0_seq1/g.25701  ORF comp20356_c0_seq1/g.25701 comp20356_c0_seq1/m.25701 type:complete len:305 (+) comp20356_c0_seq1:422-1336(+)